MSSFALLVVASLGSPVAHAVDTGIADCSTWGEITPDVRDTYFGEFVTFRVSGGRSCGDVDTCSWWSDGNQGDFLQTSGSPVTWRAPEDLSDCVTLELRVWASCTDGNTTGSSTVSVRCTHDQLDEVKSNRDAQLSGGGCNGPLAPSDSSVPALLLLPLLGWGWRRRGEHGR